MITEAEAKWALNHYSDQFVGGIAKVGFLDATDTRCITFGVKFGQPVPRIEPLPIYDADMRPTGKSVVVKVYQTKQAPPPPNPMLDAARRLIDYSKPNRPDR